MCTKKETDAGKKHGTTQHNGEPSLHNQGAMNLYKKRGWWGSLRKWQTESWLIEGKK